MPRDPVDPRSPDDDASGNSPIRPDGAVGLPAGAPASRPVISVIVATLNSATTLERCLASAFEQTWPAVELIVMDGGSSDGTVAILEHEAARIAAWASERDRGIYHAWNKALARATGDWICFLGADDRFAAPDVLARLAGVLAADGGQHRVVYGSVRIVDAEGREIRRVGQPWVEARAGFRTDGMTIPHPGTLHHRSLFSEHGPFDESFRIAGDYELLLRELLDADALFVPDLVTVEMGADGLSARSDMALRVATEAHRARRMHRLTRRPAWLVPAIARMRIRAALTRRLGPRAADRVVAIYRATLGRARRTTS